MGHLARLVQRALGAENALRPAIDRWNFKRVSANGDGAGLFALEGRVVQNVSETVPGIPVRVTPARSVDRRARDAAQPAAVAPHVQARDVQARDVAALDRKLETPRALRAPDAPAMRPDARIASEQASPRREEAAVRAVRAESVSSEQRLLPPQAVSAVATARRNFGAIENARTAPAADEPAPVYVHIGRIDVRAVDAPAPKAKAPAAGSALRRPSLEAHLSARDRGTA